MKPATLLDTIYRLSFKNQLNKGWKSNSEMRRALESARRFTIDDSMSAFMAELANEAFLRVGESPLQLKIADSLRVSARLPHQAIWIEYNLRAYQARSTDMRGLPRTEPYEMPSREGWLIQQHPAIPTACIMHLFTMDDHIREDGFRIWTFPFAYAWCNDDSPLPWRTILKANNQHGERREASSLITGVNFYERDNVSCVYSPLIDDPFKYNGEALANLLHEWAGVIRRVWALLATIDNLPVIRGEARTSKGFLGKGQMRKYLAHQTITLNVPAKTDTRVLARKAIAHVHRRRHEVLGHWRNDWRHMPSDKCNPHLWECTDENADHIECSVCRGRQTYIHTHERGDAGIGYVTHDYLLKHRERT